MKKLLFLFAIVGMSLSSFAQIQVAKDTVHHYFHANDNVLSESKVLISSGSLNPIDVKWKIIYDDVKTTWDTNVQFCDCDVCLTNYPDSSVCSSPLDNANPYLFKMYVRSMGNKQTRYLTIVLTDMNDASVTDTVTFVTDPSIVFGVGESILGSEDDFKLAPNPTNGKTRMTYGSVAGGSVDVMVYDLLGNSAYQETMQVDAGISELDFDFSNLERGIYFVNVTDGQKSFTKKLSLK